MMGLVSGNLLVWQMMLACAEFRAGYKLAIWWAEHDAAGFQEQLPSNVLLKLFP